MKFKPLYNRILVKIIKAEEKSAGGIVLTSENKNAPSKGEVIAVGNGKLLENGMRSEIAVSVGDIVLFGRYTGEPVEIEGNDCLIFNDTDVICTIEE